MHEVFIVSDEDAKQNISKGFCYALLMLGTRTQESCPMSYSYLIENRDMRKETVKVNQNMYAALVYHIKPTSMSCTTSPNADHQRQSLTFRHPKRQRFLHYSCASAS